MTSLNIEPLAHQMGIDEVEIAERKALLGLTLADTQELTVFHKAAHQISESVVEEFYVHQLQIPQVRRVIGDSETLGRLTMALKGYVARLFSGEYGQDYVDSRLRIGRTHARLGVAPKIYISSLYFLKRVIEDHLMSSGLISAPPKGLEKLFLFDLELAFDTYIKELLDEVEMARASSRGSLVPRRMGQSMRQPSDRGTGDSLPRPEFFGPHLPPGGHPGPVAGLPEAVPEGDLAKVPASPDAAQTEEERDDAMLERAMLAVGRDQAEDREAG